MRAKAANCRWATKSMNRFGTSTWVGPGTCKDVLATWSHNLISQVAICASCSVVIVSWHWLVCKTMIWLHVDLSGYNGGKPLPILGSTVDSVGCQTQKINGMKNSSNNINMWSCWKGFDSFRSIGFGYIPHNSRHVVIHFFLCACFFCAPT